MERSSSSNLNLSLLTIKNQISDHMWQHFLKICSSLQPCSYARHKCRKLYPIIHKLPALILWTPVEHTKSLSIH